MNRRFFTKLLSVAPLAYFLPEAKSKTVLQYYPNVYVEKPNLDDWVILGGNSTNFKIKSHGYHLIRVEDLMSVLTPGPVKETGPYRATFDRPYSLDYCKTYSSKDIEKEKYLALKALPKNAEILHKVHVIINDEHRFIIVYNNNTDMYNVSIELYSGGMYNSNITGTEKYKNIYGSNFWQSVLKEKFNV